MTKSLKQLSQALLAKFSDSSGNPVTGRFSSPADLAAETKAIKQLVAGDSWQSPSGARVFEFLHQDAYCVALTFVLSEDECACLNEESEGSIKPIEVPGSIFLFLADRLDLRPTELEPLRVEEHIAGPASDEDGVELEVVKQFLEGVSVFQLSSASIFKTPTPGRYVANYICTFDPCLKGNNRLTPRSLEIVREIFLQERDRLIEDNLFEAMATPLLRHAFLEVYRTLEFVFVLPRASALLEQLRLVGGTLDIKILDFARYCNKELGWKRVELDSIRKLFREYAVSNYGAFQVLPHDCRPFAALAAASPAAAEEERIAFVEKVADRYYKLRNQVAHQFWPEEMLPCDDADWQMLIEFTLGCVAYFYSQHLSKAA